METIANLQNAKAKALGFAQKIAHYCKETIGYLLAKANMNMQALETQMLRGWQCVWL